MSVQCRPALCYDCIMDRQHRLERREELLPALPQAAPDVAAPPVHFVEGPVPPVLSSPPGQQETSSASDIAYGSGEHVPEAHETSPETKAELCRQLGRVSAEYGE